MTTPRTTARLFAAGAAAALLLSACASGGEKAAAPATTTPAATATTTAAAPEETEEASDDATEEAPEGSGRDYQKLLSDLSFDGNDIEVEPSEDTLQMFQAIAQMEEEDADKITVEPEECKSLPSIINLDDAEAEQVAQAITPGLEVMILAVAKDAMSYDLGKLKEHRDKCGTSTRSMGEQKETQTLTPVDFDVDADEVQAYKFTTTGAEEDYEAISVNIMKGDTYLAFDLSETTDEALGKLKELVNEVLGRLN